MKQYLSNRVREAFKITNVWAHPLGGTILDGEGEDGVIVQAAYMEKHQPEIGGYYVKYPDDGYESFCPADVFEAGNIEVPTTPKARVEVELAELREKLQKLGAFFETPVFRSFEEPKRHLMYLQSEAMRAYAHTLQKRLEYWDTQLPNEGTSRAS